MNEILFREETRKLMEDAVGEYSISYSAGTPYSDAGGGMHIDVDIFSGSIDYEITVGIDDDDPNRITIQGDGYQDVADVQGILISLLSQAEAKIR